MAEDVAASLPQLSLPPGATVTVQALDAAAVVTSLNVKVFQVRPTVAAREPDPILLPGSG
jgi:hypothetical protein